MNEQKTVDSSLWLSELMQLVIRAQDNQDFARDILSSVLKRAPELAVIHDKFGFAPVHYAAMSNLLQPFAEHAPDSLLLPAVKVDQRTPIFYAAQYGHLEAVQAIVDKHPEAAWSPVTLASGATVTPLNDAQYKNRQNVIEYLKSKQPAAQLAGGASGTSAVQAETLVGRP